jgi:hypothetical protein
MKQSLKTVIVSFIVAGFLDGVAAIIILGNYNFTSGRKNVQVDFPDRMLLKAERSWSFMDYYLIFIAFIWTIIYHFVFYKNKIL